MSCIFCDIIAGRRDAWVVFEDELTLAFLDKTPLFHGHTLLVPKEHHETLPDLPVTLIAPLFANVRLLAEAVKRGTRADGSFVALNNTVSQSVPHLHVHVVPRRQGDGLRGFFWPRHKYTDDAQRAATRDAIRDAMNT